MYNKNKINFLPNKIHFWAVKLQFCTNRDEYEKEFHNTSTG